MILGSVRTIKNDLASRTRRTQRKCGLQGRRTCQQTSTWSVWSSPSQHCTVPCGYLLIYNEWFKVAGHNAHFRATRCGLSGLNLAKTVPCGYALSENPMSDLRLPDIMWQDVVSLPPSNAPPSTRWDVVCLVLAQPKLCREVTRYLLIQLEIQGCRTSIKSRAEYLNRYIKISQSVSIARQNSVSITRCRVYKLSKQWLISIST